MIIKDEDVFMTVLAALHPDGDGLIAGTVPIDKRPIIKINVDNWVYNVGGKNDPGETPVVTAEREAAEEGWLLQKGAIIYEVYRGIKKGFGIAKPITFSVCVCDTPMVKDPGEYKEKHRGLEQRKIQLWQVEKLWETGGSCASTVIDIYRRVLNKEKNIKPINQSNKGNWFVYD